MSPLNGKERLMCVFPLARSHTDMGSHLELQDSSLSIKYKMHPPHRVPSKAKIRRGKVSLLTHRRSSRIESAVPKDAIRKEEWSPQG